VNKELKINFQTDKKPQLAGYTVRKHYSV